MKKNIFSLVVILFASIVNAQTMEYNTRAFAIQELDPILETTEGMYTVTIIPQIVTYYNCQGNIESKHKQYNISFSFKFMGVENTLSEHTISGETLCLLKVLAQQTQTCIASGGNKGLVIDNGIHGSGAFRLQVAKFKKKWRMSLYTGVYTQNLSGYITLSPKVTQEFVDTLARVELE